MSVANLVKRALCVSVTNAPVERVFSHGGIVLRPHRSSLAPQRLHEILFLKCKKHVFDASENSFSLCNKIFIFVLHDQLLAKNAHPSLIHSIQKIAVNIYKKISKCLLF